jgi:hypothetical protein
MGDRLLSYMLKSADPRARASANCLIDAFGRTSDIEDLITQLEARVNALEFAATGEGRAELRRLGNSRGFLSESLREWFREIHTRPASAYADFSGRIVQSGDVVITFNYDDSLELELRRTGKWDVSQGYGFPLGCTSNSSDVLVLKLHGSTNWLVSIFGGATGGALVRNPISSLGNHPMIHRADLEFLGYETFSGQAYKGGGSFPCLILPGRAKEFFYDTSFGQEFAEFWDCLWSQADQVIQRCDKIVICGYSLLQADQRARDLLLQRPRKDTQVEVVAGNQTDRIANDLRAAGFSDVIASETVYFGDWCKQK